MPTPQIRSLGQRLPGTSVLLGRFDPDLPLRPQVKIYKYLMVISQFHKAHFGLTLGPLFMSPGGSEITKCKNLLDKN
jgi:hypothetical protein